MVFFIYDNAFGGRMRQFRYCVNVLKEMSCNYVDMKRLISRFSVDSSIIFLLSLFGMEDFFRWLGL